MRVAIVCVREKPKVPMTLVEQLRSKKALRIEELADILCIAIRRLYKEAEDNHIPFSEKSAGCPALLSL